MKHDLYGALGIGMNASKEDVRKAYRRKAKAAHPDTGGSAEQFALVTLAHDTLTDEKRRRHYDETGEAGGKSPDATLNNAMELAFMTIQRLVLGILQKGGDPEEFDLVKGAIESLQANLKAMAEEVKGRERDIARAERVAKRFRAKEGKDDIFSPMWAAQIGAMKDAVRVATADKPKTEMAIALLKDADFDVKKRPESGAPPGWSSRQLGFADLINQHFS